MICEKQISKRYRAGSIQINCEEKMTSEMETPPGWWKLTSEFCEGWKESYKYTAKKAVLADSLLEETSVSED